MWLLDFFRKTLLSFWVLGFFSFCLAEEGPPPGKGLGPAPINQDILPEILRKDPNSSTAGEREQFKAKYGLPSKVLGGGKEIIASVGVGTMGFVIAQLATQ